MIPFEIQLTSKRVRVVLFREKSGGSLYARWWWQGKMYSRTTGHEFEREAKARARDMVAEVAGSDNREPLTLGQAVQAMDAARWPAGSKDHHRRTTLMTLNRFVARAGNDLDIHGLSFDRVKHVIQAYLDDRKKLVESQTVINEQRHLSRLFSWLEQRGHVQWKQINPASRRALQDLPRVHHTPRPPVSPRDLVIMLKAARKKAIWPSVLLCLTAGMRCAGTLRCRWEHLNFKTGKLRVTEKGRDRHIPLDAWTLEELKTWQKKGVDAEWIVGRDSRLMWHDMQQIRRTHKLGPEVTMQGCRRTFISMCLDAGVSSELVASLCGNSVAVIEKHYKDLRTMNADHVPALLNFRQFVQGHSKNHSKKRR